MARLIGFPNFSLIFDYKVSKINVLILHHKKFLSQMSTTPSQASLEGDRREPREIPPRQKRSKVKAPPNQDWDMPIDETDKCLLCTLPWRLDQEEAWMDAHESIVQVALAAIPLMVIDFGQHRSGCFAQPLPDTWMTIHALKFMASISNIDSVNPSPYTTPLVRVTKVNRRGIYSTIVPVIHFFVPKSSSFVTLPSAFMKYSLPHTAFPLPRHFVASTDEFDLPLTLDHSRLEVFQRALLAQTLDLCGRRSFLKASFDRRAVTRAMTSATTVSEAIVPLAPSLIIRKSKRDDFVKFMDEMCMEDARHPAWYSGGILLSKTGTGKTVMGSRLVNHWWATSTAALPLLILAPTNMFATWLAHLSEWTSIPSASIHQCGGGKKTPGDAVFSTKCVILTSKSLWCRRRNLHAHTFSRLLLDEVHIQLPPRPSFPKLAQDGCAIGLTATITDEVDLRLLANLGILRPTYPHNAAIFDRLVGLQRIEHHVFDPFASLPSQRYSDTSAPFVLIPRSKTTTIPIHHTEQDKTVARAYLTMVKAGLMKRYSIDAITEAALTSAALPPFIYNRVYLDLHRLAAGDERIVDPARVVMPPGINLSKDPFIRLLKHKPDISLGEGHVCAICRDDDLTEAVQLGCKHCFCLDCIKTWYLGPRSQGRKCPTCRKAIKTGWTTDASLFHDATPQARVSYLEPGGNARKAALVTYMTKLPPSAKLVIAVRFPRIVKVLERLLKTNFPETKVKCCYVNQTPERRMTILDSFARDSSIKVLIVQYSVAGVGINLTAASHLLTYDSFLSYEFDQLKGRLLRMGQKNEVVDVTILEDLDYEKSYLSRKGAVIYELDHPDPPPPPLIDLSSPSSLPSTAPTSPVSHTVTSSPLSPALI